MSQTLDQRLTARPVIDVSLSDVFVSSPQDAFDRITRLAQRLFDVEFAVISLVQADRQRIVCGLGDIEDAPTELPLNRSWCRFVVASGEVLVVDDTLESPLLNGIPGLRADLRSYAGHPLTDGVGKVIGTLCVAGARPRLWGPDELQALGDLAAMAQSEIDHRIRSQLLERMAGIVERSQENLDGLVEAVVAMSEIAEEQEDPRLARLSDVAKERLEPLHRDSDDLRVLVAGAPHEGEEPVLVDVRTYLREAVALVTSGDDDRRVVLDLATEPLWSLMQPGALQRALSLILMRTLHQLRSGESVKVGLSAVAGHHGEAARLEVHAPGSALPVLELVRLVSRLARVGGPGRDTPGEPTLSARHGATTVRKASVSATTGTTGTTVSAQWPLLVEPAEPGRHLRHDD